jgi:hypothetical protein
MDDKLEPLVLLEAMQMHLDERGHELADATIQSHFLKFEVLENIVSDRLVASSVVLDRYQDQRSEREKLGSDDDISLTTDGGGVTNPQN